MNPPNDSMTVWSPTVPISIKSNQVSEIVGFAAPQLSPRDIRSIALAFENQSYEMAATFVWTKAAAVLKGQLAALGMDFVGEMLGRADISSDSDPSTSLADYEAISLAEDLGLVNSTQGIRLRHSLELVTHFLRLEHEKSEEEMEETEAVSLLKACVTSILGQPKFENAIKFANFRASLGTRSLKDDDPDIAALITSPYFFVRTTLSILLSLVKVGKGAQQEHAIGNLSTLLPLLWEARLRELEKWQVGQSYAEVTANGDRASSAGLKRALLKVHGFDFVPESLRSNTFSEAAVRVLAAHFSFNNFYKEVEPMTTLADLGTAIPKPAFGKCMEATLAIWLGNQYNFSYAATPPAKRVLDGLRKEQWEYYLNECLWRDRTILEKLMWHDKCIQRWSGIVKEFTLALYSVKDPDISKLIQAAGLDDLTTVKRVAGKLRQVQTE